MYMRAFKIIFSFIFLFGIENMQAQHLTLHAYKQASIPGVRQTTIDLDGNRVHEEKKETYNYWFYLELPAEQTVSVTDLWIGGKKYLAKSEKITKTPVLKLNYSGNIHPDTLTLVPETMNQVILIYPAGENLEKDSVSNKTSETIKDKELVIRYTKKGKPFWICKKEIISLPPEIRL